MNKAITHSVQIQGNRFICNGQEIRLRGVNLGNWLLLETHMLGLPYMDHKMREAFIDVIGVDIAQRFWRTYEETYISETDFAQLYEWGFNFVRLPFNYRLIEDDLNPGVYKESGFAPIDRAIEWGKKYGIYVELDLHAAPGGQATDWNTDITGPEALLWRDANYQQRTIDLWGAIAERYSGHPAVLGYSPLCEPVCPDTHSLDDSILCDFYHRVIDAIREHDSDHIILLEANEWGQRIEGLADSLFEDPQVTYQPHMYPTSLISPDNLKQYPGMIDGQLYDRQWLEQQLSVRVDEGRIRRPIIIGEFGMNFVKGTAFDIIDDVLKIFEQRRWSWCLWGYKDIGPFGLTRPKSDTPWNTFVNRPDFVKKKAQLLELTRISDRKWDLKGGKWACDIREIFPDADQEIFFRVIRESQRNCEKLMLHHMVDELAKYPEEEILAMASSFAHENCVHEKKGIAMLTKITGGSDAMIRK